jgi:OmpA-OmpF porin, OOP family
MKKFTIGLLITLLVAFAGTAYANQRDGAFTVSPFVGGYTFDGVERMETRPMVGIRLGYDFIKCFGLEGSFNYVSTKFNTSTVLSRLSPGSISVYNYRLQGIYNFMSENALVPYLGVGGGGESIDLGNRDKTYPTANASAGVKWFLGEDVAVRLDYTQNFIINHDSVLSNARQDYVTNYEYSLGLQMLFGGKKPLPPASSLMVMPGSIMLGKSATLSWTSQNVTNCAIQPGVGPVEPQGRMDVSPKADTTYTLTCNGPDGATSSMVNVAVSTPPPPPPPPPAAPASTLSVAPGSITQGESATLTWNAQNSTNCDLQPGIGPVQAQGSMNVTPQADTAYTLTCTGPGGSTSSLVNVAVAAPPPPPPPSCPVVLTPEQEETVNLLIEFDSNKTVIKPQFYPNLDALGEFMKKYPCEVTVEGHTDNVGKKAYNQKLSQRRAEAVKKYIVDKFGIDPKMIKTVGYGETKPVDTNKTPEGRYHNRRVQAHHAAVKK